MTEQFYDQYEAAVQKGDRSCRCEEQEGACKRIGKPSGELVEEEPQAARTPAALTAAMAVINERREIFFMENSFDQSMILWLWQLVSDNQPQSILSNSLSFVGCYGNGSANLCDGKNSHKNRVRP